MFGAVDALIERSDDLRKVRAEGELVSHGSGRLVLIEAEAGLGKTTLLTQSVEELRAAGFAVFSARGSEREGAHAFGVVHQLFGEALADESIRQRVLSGAASTAGAVFSVPPADREERHADLAAAQVLYGLFWMVSNLAQDQRIAIVVDDVHDVDRASMGFLSYIARRVSELPVLVVLAARPAGQVGSRRDLDDLRADAAVRTLAPLTQRGSQELLATVLNRECSVEFARVCHAATGGNPFYLRALAEEVVRRQITPNDEQAPRVSDLGPPVILRAILFRLGDMTSGAVELARAVAVLGDGARLPLAAALAGVGLEVAAAAADALVAGGVLAAGVELGFVHAIVRSAVLADTGADVQAAMHASAARLLREFGAQSHVVAMHLMRSAPVGDSEAVATLRAAAELAVRAGSPALAVNLLARAVAEPPPDEQLGDVLDELGRSEAACGSPEALTHLAASIERTADARKRGERALVFAGYAQKGGAVLAAVDVLEAALATLEDDGSDLVTALRMEHYWDAHIHLESVGRVGDGRARLRAALDRPDGELRRRAAAYLAMDAALLEDRTSAVTFAHEALAAPGLLDFCPPDASSVMVMLLALSAVEEHASFTTLADSAAAAAAREGNLLAFLIISTFRAVEALSLGRLADVESESEAIATASAREGWRHGTPGLIAVTIEALLEQGRIAQAQAVFASTGDIYCDEPVEMPTALLLYARGRLRTAAGDLRGGLADLLSCGDRMERLLVHSPGMIDWRAHASLACLKLGDIDRATELATANRDVAERLCGPARRAGAWRVLAQVSGGDEAVAMLEHATALLTCSPALLERARVLTELGTRIRERGDVVSARRYLADALEAAVLSGAQPIEAVARAELRSAGARPQRAQRTGIDSLTPAELRVAQLAAAGATNTAIAQDLFLSRKTVEKHLANAYRKLGIASRVQLNHALRSGGA